MVRKKVRKKHDINIHLTYDSVMLKNIMQCFSVAYSVKTGSSVILCND
jgi:hypothetical protein